MTSSANRITGLATGLDVDSIVTASLKPYQTKIDTKTQQKDTLSIKQTMYREIITGGRDLFNKYFDITKTDNLLSSKTYATTTFTPSDSLNRVTATAVGGAVKDTYSVNVTTLASSASSSLGDAELSAALAPAPGGIEINYNGKTATITAAELSAGTDNKAKAAIINNKLSSIGMKATYSDFTKAITVETTTTGATTSSGVANTFTMSINGANVDPAKINAGTDLKATISNSKGTIYYGYNAADVPAGAITATSSKNSVTLDGVTFNATATTGGGAVTFTPGTDVSALKTKIVNFFNDYNTYIKKLNTYVSDVHDRDYNPLTADQKKAMSADEVTAWNEKVKKGQLYNDTDLTRIANSLKNAIGNSVIGASTTLEKIGITPVKNYDTDNGTFTIDESALTQALQTNPDAVMQIFTKSAPTDPALSSTQVTSQTGIANRMKDILNNEVVLTTKSTLIKKAGIEGSISFTQNTLSKQISDYATKIKQMTKDLSSKEQNLYNKYSKLETTINTYNAQQSQLKSALGIS